MNLLTPNLTDRAFLIQFQDIISEFGNKIPRLEKVKNLKYITNKEVFKALLFEQLGLANTEKITPYILTTDDDNKEYIGGLLSFSASPERFKDPNNELIRQQLKSEKYAYITCLQIRDAFRPSNRGVELLSKSTERILTRFHKVRGVVSQKELLGYYKYIGAEVVNYEQNEDGLFILVGDEKHFKKRH